MNAKAELEIAVHAAIGLARVQAKERFRCFVPYLKDDYEMIWFHKLICNKLDDFEQGRIKKLMIFTPPQHGKTELTTRSFPPYLVGKNPNRRIAVVTYNDTIANSFNRAIQRKIDSQAYLELFPQTKLNDSKFHNVREADKQRNTDMIDILGGNGSIKTLGRGGSLTGFPVDIGIIDDPIKDRSEAQSETIREGLYSWYTDVFLTRLHNKSQQLIIQTRWHEHDLAGRILAKEDDWEVIKLPAIRTADVVEYDPRQEGEALWPERHSLQKILDAKNTNEVTFNSLYQQDPKPNSQILVYKDWIEIPEWPDSIRDVSWGLDFGKTTGINALVKGTVVAGEPRNIAYLKECLYAPKIPPLDIAKVLRDNGYVDGQLVWCDHIPTKINELRLLGITAVKAVKGPGSIASGIDKMNEYEVRYMGKNIRMEKNLYQYVTYDTLITNVPVDEHNHCFVGETLIHTADGLTNISEVKKGDYVLTSKGYKKVLIKWDNGVQQVNNYTLQLDTFSVTLTCTPNHLIKTNLGWVQISKLQSGMTISCSKLSTGKHTRYTQTSGIFQEVQLVCTSWYGNTLMAKFLKAFMFIMSMKIHGIISRITWKSKSNLNTKGSILKKESKIFQSFIKIFRIKAKNQLKPGTQVQKAYNGIANMLKKQALGSEIMDKHLAQYAQKSLQKRMQPQSFAETTVRPRQEDYPRLMLWSDFVQDAAQGSWPINIQTSGIAANHALHQVSVSPIGNRQVYDLTVKDAHEYFANGVLVHNCMDAARYCLLSKFFRERGGE